MPSRRVSRKRSQKKSRKHTRRGSKRKFFGSIKRGVSNVYNYLRTKTIEDSPEALELRRKLKKMYNVLKNSNKDLGLGLDLSEIKTNFTPDTPLKQFKKDLKNNIFLFEDCLQEFPSGVPNFMSNYKYLSESVEMLKEGVAKL